MQPKVAKVAIKAYYSVPLWRFQIAQDRIYIIESRLKNRNFSISWALTFITINPRDKLPEATIDQIN